MKEELNLRDKHCNAVWGLNELIVGVLRSVWLSAAPPEPGVPPGIAGKYGEGKNSFSASSHQLLCKIPRLVWDPFNFSTDVFRE